MGYKNREIERKFVIAEKDYNSGVRLLKRAIGNWDRLVTGDSTDIYFEVPSNLPADFARVRMMPRGKAQLTIKYQDRDCNLDRVEIDVNVDDPAQAIAFCTHLFGYPARSVRKKYLVLFLDDRDTNVSIYTVRGDKRVFIEIEARTVEKVEKITKRLGKKLSIEVEKRSIYQLFVKRK